MCQSARRETAASPRSRRGPKPCAGVPKNGTPLDAFFASRFSISLSPSFLARCVRESRRARGQHNHGCRSRRGGDRDWRFAVPSVDTAPRITLFSLRAPPVLPLQTNCRRPTKKKRATVRHDLAAAAEEREHAKRAHSSSATLRPPRGAPRRRRPWTLCARPGRRPRTLSARPKNRAHRGSGLHKCTQVRQLGVAIRVPCPRERGTRRGFEDRLRHRHGLKAVRDNPARSGMRKRRNAGPGSQ